jgi:hypothetical protein
LRWARMTSFRGNGEFLSETGRRNVRGEGIEPSIPSNPLSANRFYSVSTN